VKNWAAYESPATARAQRLREEVMLALKPGQGRSRDPGDGVRRLNCGERWKPVLFPQAHPADPCWQREIRRDAA
jgi:hypothetical protein